MPTSGTPEIFRFRVHLQPRAARTRIVGRHGEALKVQVHAPPVSGAANTALLQLLADVLGVPRRDVRIVHGDRSREKLIEVRTDSPDACARRLQDAAPSAR